MDWQQVDRLSLIDVSNEDDSLLSAEAADSASLSLSSPSLLDIKEQSECGEKVLPISCEAVMERQNDVTEPLAEVEDNQEPQIVQPKRKRQTAKCNLRKSLAWDQAFFTSEGVLDAEELSFLTGALAFPNNSLPCISGSQDSSFPTNKCFEQSIADFQSPNPPAAAAAIHASDRRSSRLLEHCNIAKHAANKAMTEAKQENHSIGGESKVSVPLALAGNKRMKVGHAIPLSAFMGFAANGKLANSAIQISRESEIAPKPTLANRGVNLAALSKERYPSRAVASIPNHSYTANVNRRLLSLTQPIIKQSANNIPQKCTSKQNGETDNLRNRSKPSGLRKPSPKLGFFDSDTLTRRPTITWQSRVVGACALPPRPTANAPSHRVKPPTPYDSHSLNLKHPCLNSSQRISHSPQAQKIESKARSEVSGLLQLAQKKFGTSPHVKPSKNVSNHKQMLQQHSQGNPKEVIQFSDTDYLKRLQQPLNVAENDSSIKERRYAETESLPSADMLNSRKHGRSTTLRNPNCLDSKSQGAEIRQDNNSQSNEVAENEVKSNARSPLRTCSKSHTSCAQETLQKLGRMENDSNLSAARDVKGKDNMNSIGGPAKRSPLDAVPFSDEWISAIEAVGEEMLQSKGGPVQHSPPNKQDPQPGPWSPVRRQNQQLGPFDCTKYTTAHNDSCTSKQA